MKQIHLQACASTQDYILEHLDKNSDDSVLVSTNKQDNGYGRKGAKWENADDCLAFSFTVSPNELLQLTTMEIACLISLFFKEKFKKEVSIKWPNDLIHNNKKIGGIIAKIIDDKVVCGVGINLSNVEVKEENSFFPPGYLDIELKENFQEKVPRDIIEFILINRKSSKQIIEMFNSICDHFEREVIIKNIDQSEKEIKGVFKGINSDGGAIIRSNEKRFEVFNGSLFYN